MRKNQEVAKQLLNQLASLSRTVKTSYRGTGSEALQSLFGFHKSKIVCRAI
jgi:hypothetical protein